MLAVHYIYIHTYIFNVFATVLHVIYIVLGIVSNLKKI